LWNVEHPDRVLAIQQRYADAGSDCLITNTFGGCRIMLDRHDCGGKTSEINHAAVEIARQAFGDKPGYVLGDIGPFGGLMEPLGDVPVARVREAFHEQAAALVGGEVDAIIVETQTSLEELTLGIEAAQQAGAACVIASMAYDVTLDGSEIRTMMGVDPEQAAHFIRDAGADIVAVNCGTGVDARWAAQCVARYRAVCDLPTMAQPNAGVPVLENLRPVYQQSPDEMATDIPAMLEAGVDIVGACCGSTPQHIRRIRELVDLHNQVRHGGGAP
jgi:5-methyltetrahydrofolate--homocysteine methyltransferase